MVEVFENSEDIDLSFDLASLILAHERVVDHFCNKNSFLFLLPALVYRPKRP